jgi:hypothetical protein
LSDSSVAGKEETVRAWARPAPPVHAEEIESGFGDKRRREEHRVRGDHELAASVVGVGGGGIVGALEARGFR